MRKHVSANWFCTIYYRKQARTWYKGIIKICTGGTRGATELNQWIASEKQEFATVMERYGVEWLQKGTHEKYLLVIEFEKKEWVKEVAELDSQKQEISSVVT